MQLTGYDCYAPARALQGREADRTRCSAAGAALLDRLLPIPTPTDRVRLLSTLVTSAEQGKIALTPVNALHYAIQIATNGLVVYAPTEGLRGYAQRLEA